MKDSRRAGSVLGASLCESYFVLGTHDDFSFAMRVASPDAFGTEPSCMVMQTAEFASQH